MEIYNNQGYDLLYETNDQERCLESLPKVQTFINEDGLVLKNLLTKKSASEEEMLQILFIGDTNRVVC